MSSDTYLDALRRVLPRVEKWLDGMKKEPITSSATKEEVMAALGEDLPNEPVTAADVVDHLADAAEPGLVRSPSGRFFGFVIGGTLPAAMAADWLVSAWDQNAGLSVLSPAHAAVEQITSQWLLDLFGLPSDAAVGYTTGGTMANFTGLAAGRDAVLTRAGWDVQTRGLNGAPPVRVLVGAERHISVDLALRYLGLGEAELVAVDDQGRIRTDAVAEALGNSDDGPTLLCLQAGNIHSGAFDPFAQVIPLAHETGAWVHVDGAFGLFGAIPETTQHLTDGVAGADSWATDAHKTLNVPFDSGIAIVREPAALGTAMSGHGDYLIMDQQQLDPYERVPEMSRRARAIPVWAALRSLGRSGVTELVERLCRTAATLAEEAARLPGVEVLNDVVFTQVCMSFGSDERTQEVGRRLMDDGVVWISGSHWGDRDILRISVSNWATDKSDIETTIAALRHAIEATEG